MLVVGAALRACNLVAIAPCCAELGIKPMFQCLQLVAVPARLVQLALVILMITAVHFVEAYGLNPAIYSAHLKLHPLLVLAVLVVAEHSLGVWGLLLAVPLTVFTLDYVVSTGEERGCLVHGLCGLDSL
jgi:hypothetical protein